VSRPDAAIGNSSPRADGPVWAVIAGGGTGGHVVPAVAIGRALVERGRPTSAIHFIGSRRGIEARMVPAAGFEVTLLPGRGIARRLTLDNVGAVAGLVSALFRALVLVRRLRPSVVIAVGGYASAAAALAAVVWRIPLVVAEQNAVPGLANRLAGRFAAACAVSFDGTPLPRAVTTGNPVRPEIAAADTSPDGRARARAELGIPGDRLVVLAAGGSLGARRINTAVADLARKWADRSDICIRHVIGRRDYAEVTSRPVEIPTGGLLYQAIEFEDRMDLALTAADVSIQRAGASTFSELTVIGLPSVLVPLPNAPGDHQTANARRLADAGAAVVVPDAGCDAERLETELGRILSDPSARERMGRAALALGRPDAADRVAALAESKARTDGRAGG
jgi:UDP-N-acetylglucosamine--N-acetylmuramyl-(pentapeptide) pyrophosphoryl-undecaprenol N-acetylglucosamine transferase